MCGVADKPYGAWRKVEVRFMASGRAEQTPVEIKLGEKRYMVRLCGEKLLSKNETASPVSRSYLLELEGGSLLELARREKIWQARQLP